MAIIVSARRQRVKFDLLFVGTLVSLFRCIFDSDCLPECYFLVDTWFYAVQDPFLPSRHLCLSTIDGIRFPSSHIRDFCLLTNVWGFMWNDGHFFVLPRH